MKKLLAVALGLTAFVAFAFQSPNQKASTSTIQEDLPLVISLDGIEDGQEMKTNTTEFLAETE
jgi:energy-coupling factor transporter ATP-binding protein EcfA2